MQKRTLFLDQLSNPGYGKNILVHSFCLLNSVDIVKFDVETALVNAKLVILE